MSSLGSISGLGQSNKTMTGASASAAGAAGLVPAPAAGSQGKYLKGDGTWDSPAMSELGLSVVNGKLCITYLKEVDD